MSAQVSCVLCGAVRDAVLDESANTVLPCPAPCGNGTYRRVA